MRRALVLSLLLAALPAAQAHAGGRLIPVGASYVAGPAIAGDSLAWVGERRGGYFVERVAPDGSRARELVNAPHRAVVAFAASARHSALGIYKTHCPFGDDGCKYGPGFVTDYDVLFASSPGGGLTRVTGCESGNDCSGCADNPDVTLEPRLDGDTLAWTDPCSGSPDVIVRDLAAPERGVRTFSTGDYAQQPWAIAGDHLALVEGSYYTGTQVVVHDASTGAVRYRFGGHPLLDVRDDGLTVVVENGMLAWASEASPEPHPFARGEGSPRVAGERAAWWSSRSAGVANLDGSGVATTPVREAAGYYRNDFDFDGSRLVWATRPCGTAALVEWDLEGAAPAMPGGSCPLPAIPDRSAKLTRDRRLPLHVRCGPDPLGCRALMFVTERHQYELVAQAEFSLDAGAQRTLRPRVSREVACFFVRPHTAVLSLSVPGRGDAAGHPAQARQRLRIRAPRAACRRRR